MNDTTAPSTDDVTTSGRHPVNIGHLVMGIAFLGLLAIWALIEAGTVTGDDIRWLLPLPWVFAGVAGLLASVLAGRRTSDTNHTEPTEEFR